VLNNSTLALLPGSPTTWPRDSFRPTLTFIVVFGALVIVLVASVAALVFAMATGQLAVADFASKPPRIPTGFVLWSQYAVYVPLAAYLLLVVRPVSHLTFKTLGLGRPTLSNLGPAVLGAGVMWIAVAVVASVIEAVTHLHNTEAAVLLMRQIHTVGERMSFIWMAVVVAPLVEEFAFRVFLFNAFLRYAPFWLAALGSSILFGLAHAQAPGELVTVSIPLAAGGLVLAAVYQRTRNYWASVITHGLFNSASVIAFFVFHVKS
jgi:membrane protease YdiL (CAAX protease family)